MSELKATHIIMVYNGEIYEDFEIVPCTQLYYRKSEADNVIAEKDKELRHHKYKRCLAMAKLCKRKRIDAANYRKPREKWEFYDKWYKRWLEIAERFK